VSRHRWDWDTFGAALNGDIEMVMCRTATTKLPAEGPLEFVRVHDEMASVRPSGPSGVSEVDPTVKVALRPTGGQEEASETEECQ
jgi:hypothetical protein